ncbi:unnamed protein product [Vitrella brassicaformis CCMP3155]|uniref:Uncharacterized protein n=1 Tax=Vitrella brassicaformis (strain CCMP3155) TaxID=1169540 RepID=A0A0G4G281_VITBC|nr:unnamed protein product [Vitrella brassicaformis CCMP3155]|eukprot:CEM22193.1 unnamed protein product [Vitrella brassicaformis CCMP3155]
MMFSSVFKPLAFELPVLRELQNSHLKLLQDAVLLLSYILLWILSLCLLWVLPIPRYPTVEDRVELAYYEVACWVLGTVLFVEFFPMLFSVLNLLKFRGHRHQHFKLKVSLIMCTVEGVILCSYILLSRDLLPVHIDPVTGRAVYSARFMEWTVAAPMLVYLSGRYVFEVPMRHVLPAMIITGMYMQAGLWSAVSSHWLLRWGLEALSYIGYFAASWLMLQFLRYQHTGDTYTYTRARRPNALHPSSPSSSSRRPSDMSSSTELRQRRPRTDSSQSAERDAPPDGLQEPVVTHYPDVRRPQMRAWQQVMFGWTLLAGGLGIISPTTGAMVADMNGQTAERTTIGADGRSAPVRRFLLYFNVIWWGLYGVWFHLAHVGALPGWAEQLAYTFMDSGAKTMLTICLISLRSYEFEVAITQARQEAERNRVEYEFDRRLQLLKVQLRHEIISRTLLQYEERERLAAERAAAEAAQQQPAIQPPSSQAIPAAPTASRSCCQEEGGGVWTPATVPVSVRDVPQLAGRPSLRRLLEEGIDPVPALQGHWYSLEGNEGQTTDKPDPPQEGPAHGPPPQHSAPAPLSRLEVKRRSLSDPGLSAVLAGGLPRSPLPTEIATMPSPVISACAPPELPSDIPPSMSSSNNGGRWRHYSRGMDEAELSDDEEDGESDGDEGLDWMDDCHLQEEIEVEWLTATPNASPCGLPGKAAGGALTTN